MRATPWLSTPSFYNDELMPPSLHRRIGQLALVGFDGHSIPPEARSLAREFDLGGIILFRRNVESPEQVAQVAWEARQLARDLPLWVGVDQEGGRVARLRRPFTEWPPAIALGRSGRADLAARFARALATELAAVGISLDFAPVLDVLTNPRNPVIGDRALAETAEDAGRLGAAVVRELQARGIAACGKHFPGHGESSVDSHLELPVLDLSPERLRRVELVPFKEAIAAGVAGLMPGHLLVPALDADRPATISPAILQGLLREDLGFDGVVFTDDLDMKGIAGRLTRDQALVAAIGAGCDAGLLCGTDCATHAAALEALVHAVEREELPLKRIEEALSRNRRAKERFAGLRPLETPGAESLAAPLSADWRPVDPVRLRAIVGCEAHQRVADDMRQYA
jgi:beta-N-acetylhexosaminidase